MRSEAVARRYAEALLDLAQEHGALERLEAESKLLASLFDDKQLRAFFNSPQIPRERKNDALARALRGKVDPMLLNIARLLVDKGRIGYLPQIMREFNSMTDELRGVEAVTIVSAQPLSAEQVQSIQANVQRFTSRQSLRVETELDPSLLGGVLVRLGSRVLDGTLASRLEGLRQRLSKVQLSGAGA